MGEKLISEVWEIILAKHSLLVIQLILLMMQTGAVVALVLLAYKLGNLAIYLLLKEIYGEDKQ